MDPTQNPGAPVITPPVGDTGVGQPVGGPAPAAPTEPTMPTPPMPTEPTTPEPVSEQPNPTTPAEQPTGGNQPAA